jgi:ABC-type transport system substrate-binding protein
MWLIFAALALTGCRASQRCRDAKTLIFHLREGVNPGDGRPLTARDVTWTVNSTRDGTAVVGTQDRRYAFSVRVMDQVLS